MPKVFILDDDEMQNYLNAMMIKTMDICEVDCRKSCPEAFQYLEECKTNNAFPDILFVDLNMPVMDGFMFIRHYEQHYMRYFPQSQIIMLSNSIFDKEKEEALGFESVKDFWYKPINKNKLREIIRNI